MVGLCSELGVRQFSDHSSDHTNKRTVRTVLQIRTFTELSQLASQSNLSLDLGEKPHIYILRKISREVSQSYCRQEMDESICRAIYKI